MKGLEIRMSEQMEKAHSRAEEEKAPRKSRRKISWWVVLVYTLPFAALAAAAAVIRGRDIRNLIQVLIKLVVKA